MMKVRIRSPPCLQAYLTNTMKMFSIKDPPANQMLQLVTLGLMEERRATSLQLLANWSQRCTSARGKGGGEGCPGVGGVPEMGTSNNN